MDKDLLKRLDAILNELNDAIDGLNPDSKAASILFEPTQDLGWAVDELLGRHRKRKASAATAS